MNDYQRVAIVFGLALAGGLLIIGVGHLGNMFFAAVAR